MKLEDINSSDSLFMTNQSQTLLERSRDVNNQDEHASSLTTPEKEGTRGDEQLLKGW